MPNFFSVTFLTGEDVFLFAFQFCIIFYAVVKAKFILTMDNPFQVKGIDFGQATYSD